MIQEGNECARTLLIVLSLALCAEVSEKKTAFLDSTPDFGLMKNRLNQKAKMIFR